MSETFLKKFICKFQANNDAGFVRGRPQDLIIILSGIRLGSNSILGLSHAFNLKIGMFDNRLLSLIHTAC